ncbi:lipoprotein [Spiroplasma endosymbiont of Ammophila pubescens]|uniref:lipoprotein n=1 Tax=Spiroplasma endosymbiont of Ammophila pubescens TaxID=3066315 RepID=UPI0032B18604
MKKLLSILGAISLVGTSTTSLVACNKPQYSEKELVDLKEKNNIITKDGILEWIAPQEKPFNNEDKKWYYIVWKGKNEDNWKIIKFKYDNYKKNKVLDKYSNYELQLFQTGRLGQGYWKDICLVDNDGMSRYFAWSLHYGYFKAVYRWNLLDKPEPSLDIDQDGNVKVK